MMFVIDRFEGEFAVCESETGEMLTLTRASLPAEAAEGDVLQADGEGGYRVDYAAGEARRAAARNRLAHLFSRR